VNYGYLKVQEELDKRNLAYSHLEMDPYSKDSPIFVWKNGFNEGREVRLYCFDEDTENELSWRGKESIIGVASEQDQTGNIKSNFIWEVGAASSADDFVIMTLEESLEYIRHFIWANHNI